MDHTFTILTPDNDETFQLIADWYHKEWNISPDKTQDRLQNITQSPLQFQVLMSVDNIPIATGGIYNHVSLLDKEPRFTIYPHWLALVYTIPEYRHKGYGALLCNYIQDHAKKIGITRIHLFTDSAERLYTRLGWKEVERLTLGNRTIVVMQLDL